MKGVPAHGRGLELDGLSGPFQPRPVCESVIFLCLSLLKGFALVMDWRVLKSHRMSGSLIDEMQFKGVGWRKVLIIPASQGKVKLLSDFFCGLDIVPYSSMSQSLLGLFCRICSGKQPVPGLLSEEVKGQCFVRTQMESLGPKLFVLSFF